jgi:hypothetical protein
MIFCLEIMGIVSVGTYKMVVDTLESVWVLIGLIAIILICWTGSLATSILSDLIPAPEDITVRELNVTGTALLIGSSFTMDLHLSETNQLLKPLPGTQTGIQQQLSKDV